MALRLIPAALAFLVLGAHFLRAGHLALVVVALAIVALFFVQRPWAARAVQGALVLGALEWLRTLALLALERRAAGAPYLRMTLILAGVALATALSLLAFRSHAVKEHFRGKKHVLGLRLGSTENAILCTDLLQSLLARGLCLDGPVLCGIGGG